MNTSYQPLPGEVDFYSTNSMSAGVIAFHAPNQSIRPNLVSSDYVLRDGQYFLADSVYNSPLFWRMEMSRRIAVAFYRKSIKSLNDIPLIEGVIISNGGCDGSNGESVGPYCALFPGDSMAAISSIKQAIARALLSLPNATIIQLLDNTKPDAGYSDEIELQKIKGLLEQHSVSLKYENSADHSYD